MAKPWISCFPSWTRPMLPLDLASKSPHMTNNFSLLQPSMITVLKNVAILPRELKCYSTKKLMQSHQLGILQAAPCHKKSKCLPRTTVVQRGIRRAHQSLSSTKHQPLCSIELHLYLSAQVSITLWLMSQESKLRKNEPEIQLKGKNQLLSS